MLPGLTQETDREQKCSVTKVVAKSLITKAVKLTQEISAQVITTLERPCL